MKMTCKMMPCSILALFVFGSAAWAQTTWTGAANTTLNNAGNWDNGLPTSVDNPGTITNGSGSISASWAHANYYVTQNGGSINGNNNWTLSNGEWTLNDGGEIINPANIQGGVDGSQLFTMNGGVFNGNTLAIVQTAGAGRSATFTISGGDFDLSSQLTLNAGGTINISGGTFDIGTNLRINGSDSVLNISGGTVTVTNMLGRGGTTILTGGTTTAATFEFLAGTFLVFGPGSAGSLTIGAFAGLAQNRNINWLPGSQMSMTVTGSSTWAATDWAAGVMKYDGQDFNTLGNWAAVTADHGLGPYKKFVYDADTYTLSIIDETPPAGTVLLIQ